MSETANPMGPRIWTSRPPKKTPRWHRIRAVVAGLVVAAVVASMGLAAHGGQLPGFDLASADRSGPASDGSASDGSASDVVPGQLLVRFADDAPGNATSRARSEAGAEVINRIEQLGVEVWRVPEHAADRALAGLQRNPHVAYAERDTVVELEEVVPNDPDFGRQWGLQKVEAPTAWATSKGDASVTIAILDTGVAPVEDLKGKLLVGHNILDGTSNAADDHGHGTMAAGVAAASTDNGIGVAGYCWECSILPVKVMESSGTMSDVAAGIVWAADNGADVISMSLSGPSGTTTALNAVRYAEARGVVLVAAAGNQGDTVKRYPAAYPEVIAVAGSTETDTLYSWSNHGSWVDVAAPGVNRTPTRSGAFGNFAGTSSATPAVAGVLGLALTADVDASALRAALQEGSVPLDGVVHGRVDARAMLELLGADAGTEPEPEPGPEPEPVPELEPDEPPTASFTATCDDLECVLDASNSSASDSKIVTYDWGFGDHTSGSGKVVSHAYAAGGSYSVRLTVTDDHGATDSKDVEVSVTEPKESGDDPSPPPEEPEPEPEPDPDLGLKVTASKQRGLNIAQLGWTGAESKQVDIRLNGALHSTVTNTGSYTHDTGLRGSPTISYQVCEQGSTATCSDVVTVSDW